MKLYLVQHGESLSKDVDPERGLTDRGKEEVTRVAAVLVKGNIRVEKILHSGKKRAQETALLLQECLAAGGEFGEMEGLAPLDPVKPVAEDAQGWQEDTMLVGHLPFMAKMVSRLTCGNEDAAVVEFTPGSVACLEREETGAWAMIWMVRPELTR